jgi:WD40 repeat protein
VAEDSIAGYGGILAAPRRHPRILAAAAAAAALLATGIVVIGVRAPATESPLATLADPGDGGTSAGTLSSGGTVAALVGENGVIYIWDVPSRRLIATLAGAGADSGTAMAFSPDAAMLAVAGDAATSVWDVAGARRVATVTDPGGSARAASTGGVLSVAFSPGGRMLAVGDGDGSSYLWNVATWRLTATLTDPAGLGVASLAFSPDGALLAAGDSNGQVDVWNVATSRRVAVHTDGESVTSVAFSPNGTSLAAGDDYGYATVWRAGAARPVAIVADPGDNPDPQGDVGPGDYSVSVAFSPDSAVLATDHCLWDIATAQRHCLARGQAFAAFRPDGRVLAFGFGQNDSITLWLTG